MEALVSSCGIYKCDSCEYQRLKQCLGCGQGNRQLVEEGQDACAVHLCTEARGIGSCRECVEASCALRRSVETICPLRSRFEKKRWWAGRMSRALENRKKPISAEADSEAPMSERVINRLRWYLTALEAFAAEGQESISSWQLAERVAVSAALIRKDLSRFGEFGTPSYGYRLDFLRERIRSILRLDKPRGIIWIGACALRHQSLALERLAGNNCCVVAVFDSDAAEIGSSVGELTVNSVECIADVLAGIDIDAAVVAVPGPEAQQVARSAVELGAKAILNISGEILVLPDHVRVRSLDLAGELAELCYYCGE